MKRHFAWLYEKQDSGAWEAKPRHETDEGRIERMRKLVAEIEAELERMRVAELEAIEKPVGKYRIYKIERADASCGKDGYYVQTWRVEQWGWELSGKEERQYREMRRAESKDEPHHLSGFELPYSYYLENALKWKDYNIPHRRTYIEWHNVGSANPHATYEDAAEWLRKWLRPEVEEVYFDEAGEPVEKAA